MLHKQNNIDSTHGPIIRLILLYAYPLIVATLLQKLFHAVDIMVLGNMGDSGAVASVGATSSFVHLIVDSFFGFATGVKIVLARDVGAKDREAIHRVVSTSLITALLLGLGLMTVGLWLAPNFLELTGCPDACYDGALLYIRFYIASAPAILIYNFGTGILNANGDTRHPLYYMIFCGVLNLILNIVLCLLLPQKVAAVAIATVASQLLGAFLVCKNLFSKKSSMMNIRISEMRWHFRSFCEILRFGLPLTVSSCLYPLANLQIQSAINSFGISAISGNTASVTLEGIASAFSGAFGATVATFIGQNFGARKWDRVKLSYRNCLWMGVTVGGVIGVLIYLTGSFWVSLIISGDADSVTYAMIRMKYVILLYGIASANTVLSHAIQAFGYPVFSSVNSIFFVLCFRMIWMRWIYPFNPQFDTLMLCFAVSWTLMLVCNAVGFLIFKKCCFRKHFRSESMQNLSASSG